MELVPGETLKGTLRLETALSYAKQIAEALEPAHGGMPDLGELRDKVDKQIAAARELLQRAVTDTPGIATLMNNPAVRQGLKERGRPGGFRPALAPPTRGRRKRRWSRSEGQRRRSYW